MLNEAITLFALASGAANSTSMGGDASIAMTFRMWNGRLVATRTGGYGLVAGFCIRRFRLSVEYRRLTAP